MNFNKFLDKLNILQKTILSILTGLVLGFIVYAVIVFLVARNL